MNTRTSRLALHARRLIAGAVLIVIALICLRQTGCTAVPLRWLFDTEAREPQPALFQSAPVRTSKGGVDRVYLLSIQQEKRTYRAGRRGLSHTTRNLLHIDLWAIDAATLAISWRKRLRTYDDRDRSGRDLRSFRMLGVDGHTLWILLENEPYGIALADGAVIADGDRIDARNPALAGRRVNEPGYVAFGRHGLQLTLDDGSQWRIDASDLSAAHRDTPLPNPDNVQGLADFSVSMSSDFLLRGMTVGERWLGLLTDKEADVLSKPPMISDRDPDDRPGAMMEFLERNHVPPALSLLPQPYRLWSARVEQVSAAPSEWPKDFPDNWGTRPKFSEYVVFPASPPFLRAGLLRAHGRTEQPLWYRDPDSLLVLHPDKLGASGRLQLSRISGPRGEIVWRIALPFDELVSVMNHEQQDLVLLGRESVTGPGLNQHDTEPHLKLVRIDVATGQPVILDLTAESFNEPLPAAE